MADESTTKIFFLGALLGGLAGGISALLLAPKSGKQMRQDIVSALKELAQEAKETVEETEEKVKGAVEKGKEGAQALKKEVKT